MANSIIKTNVVSADEEYHLYFDDTGSRDPDHNPPQRFDRMDCFGLGGILVKEEDIDTIYAMHKEFCSAWQIDYPLHSQKIRGGRGKFAWLKRPDNAAQFFPALEDFLLELPAIGIAAVIHRPGYLNRYKATYQERLWLMCKTAFSILIERSAKFADVRSRKLRVFHEQCGKKEDRDLLNYTRQLKSDGHSFSPDNSCGYAPLDSSDFKRIVRGEPRRKSKEVPMIQIADLYLYPMAKAAYDPKYRAFAQLKSNGKLIDCFQTSTNLESNGIKYSCFEELTTKNPD